MQKKFVANLALLLLLNFLIKPFWIFGIDRTVQNMLPLDYGMYFALFNFSLLFNIVLDLGITNFNNRNIAQNNHLLSEYFSGITIFKGLLFLVYLIITLVVGFVLGYDSERFYVLLFLSFNQFLISFVQYLRSNITALQLFRLDSLLSVLDKSLMILFCSLLLWGNFFSFSFTILHFIYAQTLAYLITALIVFAIVWAKSAHFTLKIDIPFLKKIIRQTFPYALLILTMVFYYRIDAVMLDFMLDDGEKEVSIYAQAYRLMDAFNQIGVLFAGLLLPMFAYLIKEKQDLAPLVKLSFSLIFLMAITIAAITFNFSEKIMNLLYHFDTDSSSKVVVVLMFCFVFIATSYIFGTLLTANGSLASLNKIALIGVLINVGLNSFLIPEYKALGAAYASLITQCIIIIGQLYLSKKIFSFTINYFFIFRMIIFLIALFFTLYWIAKLMDGFILQIGISLLCAFILGLVLKIIDPKEIMRILLKSDI